MISFFEGVSEMASKFLKNSYRLVLPFLIIAAMSSLAAGRDSADGLDDANKVGPHPLRMAQQVRSNVQCTAACRPECGMGQDGSVNGGMNALFQANACFRNCFGRCVTGRAEYLFRD